MKTIDLNKIKKTKSGNKVYNLNIGYLTNESQLNPPNHILGEIPCNDLGGTIKTHWDFAGKNYASPEYDLVIVHNEEKQKGMQLELF
ncbi:MAG: hypothetical protein NW207_04740 [Cytophagales bacterium]|nr:hypothetical protein [Cytophagales bacterium]